jgi:prolyl 4-hydroxylase
MDETRQLSEFVEVERDDVVRRVERRARKFQGWRGKSTQLQPPRVQKYEEGSFLDYHYN